MKAADEEGPSSGQVFHVESEEKLKKHHPDGHRTEAEKFKPTRPLL